jgi:hypothetical protein
MCFSNVFSLAPEINNFFRCLRLWNFSTGGKATDQQRSTFLKTGPPKRTLLYKVYHRPQFSPAPPTQDGDWPNLVFELFRISQIFYRRNKHENNYKVDYTNAQRLSWDTICVKFLNRKYDKIVHFKLHTEYGYFWELLLKWTEFIPKYGVFLSYFW